MAGAFSSHLLRSHSANQALKSSIVTSGAMSFDSTMHGALMTPQFSFFGSSMPFSQSSFANENITEETAVKIAALQIKLNQKLGPEYISQRPGPGGGPKLTYAEGWKIINLANEVFGFNGWSSNVVSVTTDFVDYNEASGRYNVGVTAVVRVTLRDGVYHEDLGYGMLENSRSKGQALDKCKKEAVTDGLKRALRNFGNLMGNCLYDKAYTQEIVKMKVPPAKFDKKELHRRPEFSEESKASINPTTTTPKPPNPICNTSNISPSLTTNRPPGSSIGLESQSISRTATDSQSAAKTNINPIASTSSSSIPHTHNQSMRTTLQPRLQQQNRHVSFVETSAQPSRLANNVPLQPSEAVRAKTESEDNFDFGDDDAFLAALNMTEGDLGRPIETEADLGQPIGHDGSFVVPQDYDTSATSVVENETSFDNMSKDGTLQNSRTARLQRLQRQIVNASEPSMASKVQPYVSGKHQSNDHSPTRTSPTDQRAKAVSHRSHPQRHQRAFARPSPISNQNENPAPSGTDESGVKPSVPSVGGFYFPPGTNPLQPNDINLQPNQPNNSAVGVKRPADAMSHSGGDKTTNSSTNMYRGPRPGMGLQQVPTLRREPLAQLDIGECGDTKRVKR